MSLLSVSSIQNPSAPQANISLNADGSVTLPVYTAPGTTPPALIQAGTLWFNTTVPTLQIRNAANTAWLPIGGGGGSGTVTSVSGTLPITVATATTTPVIAINAATQTTTGAIEIATLAEAATGTDATRAATPETSVPKDAAGMTGAAILPSGTDAQRAAIATPVAGMTRFNTDYTPDSLEVYDGSAWKQLAYVPTIPTPPDLTISVNGPLPSSGTYNNITIDAGVTATLSGSTVLTAKGNVTINGTLDGSGGGMAGASSPSLFTTSAIAMGVFGTNGQGVGAGLPPVGSPPVLPPPYGISSLLGSSGASGGVWVNNSGARGGRGGSAGATLVIRAEGDITVGASASINVNGEAGGNGFFAVGTDYVAAGGGGGSGGLIYFEAKGTLTLSAGSSMTANGGNGGNAVANTSTGGGGGGGGGGGYIVLNAPTIIDSGFKQAGVGIGGLSNGATATLAYGGSGGGFGGSGGGGAVTTTASQNGNNGQFLTNVYLY